MKEQTEITEQTEKFRLVSGLFPFVPLFPFVLSSLLHCFAIIAAGNPCSHKVHVSVANLEFNRAGQSVEIVIRVFADDLENALSQHTKRSVKIDPTTINTNKQVGDLVVGYLRDKFELRTKTGRQVKLNWVGMEGQAEMFWLYLECKLPGGLDGTQVRNRIFCEMFDDQVNIVNTKYQGKQIGLMFEGQDQFKALTDLAKK
jgi:hypothetical protein